MFCLLLHRLHFHLCFPHKCSQYLPLLSTQSFLPINVSVVSYIDYMVQYAVTSDFLHPFMLLSANKILIVSGTSFLVLATCDPFISCSTKINLGSIYWIRRCWYNFYTISISSQVESIYQSLAKQLKINTWQAYFHSILGIDLSKQEKSKDLHLFYVLLVSDSDLC